MLNNILDPMARIRQVFSQPASMGMEQPFPDAGPVNTNVDLPPELTAPKDATESAMPPSLKHQASDRLLDLLNNMPERNKPGLFRKIAATITAFSGDPNKVEHALYSPYYRQVEDFKSKFDPTYKAAEVEQKGNALETGNYYKDLLNEYRIGEADRRRTQGQQRIDQNEERIGQGQQRINQTAEQNRIKNEREERVLKLREKIANGGTILHDRQNGKNYMVYKDGTKEDVDINDLSEEQILELRKNNKIELMDEAQTRKNAFEKLKNSLILERKTQEKARGIGGRGSKEESETQKIAEVKLRANKFQNEHPNLAKYVTIDGNEVKVSPEGTGFSILGYGHNLTKEEHDQIMDYIYGGINVPKSGPNAVGNTTTPEAKGNTTPKPSAFKNQGQVIPPEGKIKVKAPDGKVGMIPLTRLKDYLEHGYQKVID
jgi:hypothetical protein